MDMTLQARGRRFGWMTGLLGSVMSLGAACLDERVDLGGTLDATSTTDTATSATDTSDTSGAGDSTSAATDTATTMAPEVTLPDALEPDSVVDDPSPRVIVAEGDEVIPQTLLHLDAAWLGADDDVVGYTWSASQPNGSTSLFVPSNTVQRPTFECNVAGVYTFYVDMRTAQGQTVQASRMIYVHPGELLHIELLWTTPGDDDETNEGPDAGTDLDLHFARSDLALPPRDLTGEGHPDPWFHLLADVFWFNAAPNWDPIDSLDDPSLDRDDVDGAGPENINSPAMVEGACYDVGVHYWRASELGPSLVTLRIYLFGGLVFEVSGVTLVEGELWHVTSLCSVDASTPPTLRKVCGDTRAACDNDDDCAGSTCGYDIAPVDGEALMEGAGRP